jgi:hypothetical protein
MNLAFKNHSFVRLLLSKLYCFLGSDIFRYQFAEIHFEFSGMVYNCSIFNVLCVLPSQRQLINDIRCLTVCQALFSFSFCCLFFQRSSSYIIPKSTSNVKHFFNYLLLISCRFRQLDNNTKRCRLCQHLFQTYINFFICRKSAGKFALPLPRLLLCRFP